MLDIILIILTSLLLVLLIIFFIYFLLCKKKMEPKDNSSEMKEIVILGEKVNSLNTNIQQYIENAVTNQLLKISNSNSAFIDSQNNKLNTFQQNIIDSVNQRFDAFNKQFLEQINVINTKVDNQLSEGLKGTNETITQVRERLQAIDDAQRNIENLSKDVVSLKTVLEGNQTRGQYGEYQLSMVLLNIFGNVPDCYKEQYTIKKAKDDINSVRADAVVFMPEPNKMICIDSKFPFKDYSKLLDNNNEDDRDQLLKEFSSAVKKHITDVKNKYIIEGKTAPEAIIFIPNDGVFAFIHHNCPDVVEYARTQKVILTSPSTLPPILWTINMVRIEYKRSKNLNEISKQLTKLGKDFKLFSREWFDFSTKLEKVTKSRETLSSRVTRITDKFDSISGSEIAVEEVPAIEGNHDE